MATIGMFDGVHRGHRFVVEHLSSAARERALSPLVLTFDRHPLTTIAPERAPRTITTAAQRADLLVEAGAGDVVILRFDESLRQLTDREFMRLMRERYDVRALLIGFNHRFGHNSRATFDDYRRMGAELGIEVVAAPELPRSGGESISSSAIRRKIAEGDIVAANEMLGRNFTLRGTVVHGRRLGHTIGFPTINIKPLSATQLLPATGVYAAEAELPSGERYKAMVNVGHNPTVADTPLAHRSVEAHLIGYDGDLYGAIVDLRFTRRLRDERKFASVDDLRAQLAIDLQHTLA